MRYPLLILAVFGLVLGCVAREATAQVASTPEMTPRRGGGAFIDRLDNFGRSIFGARPTVNRPNPEADPSASTAIPGRQNRMEPVARPSSMPKIAPPAWDDVPEPGPSSATEVSEPPVARQARVSREEPVLREPLAGREPIFVAQQQTVSREEPLLREPRGAREPTLAAQQPSVPRNEPIDPAMAAQPQQLPIAVAPGPAPVRSPSAPLHERLSGFRRPMFGSESEPRVARRDAPAGVTSGSNTGMRVEPEEDASAQAPRPTPAAARPASAPAAVSNLPEVGQEKLFVPSAVSSLGRPDAGTPDAPAGTESAPIAAPDASGRSIGLPMGPPRPAGPLAEGNRETLTTVSPSASAAEAPRATGTGPEALFTRQSPSLSAETIGPRRIAVGKEATFEVVLHNSGQVAADQVVVSVDLPEWTDILKAEGSVGTTELKAREQPGQLRWKVGRLEARGRQRLVLHLVPRQSRPFDLAVKWDYAPAPSQTLIEVEEPKLAIALQGPRELLFGKGEVYRLEVTNAGNGDAENVSIALTPAGAGDRQKPAAHNLGSLKAGQKKTIDVELTAAPDRRSIDPD